MNLVKVTVNVGSTISFKGNLDYNISLSHCKIFAFYGLMDSGCLMSTYTGRCYGNIV